MQTAFGAAIEAIFRDANVAEDAIGEREASETISPFASFANRRTRWSGFGSSRAVMATVLIDLRVSEVASPASGDTAEIGGDMFDIIGTPVRDGLGLVWTCEASRTPARSCTSPGASPAPRTDPDISSQMLSRASKEVSTS